MALHVITLRAGEDVRTTETPSGSGYIAAFRIDGTDIHLGQSDNAEIIAAANLLIGVLVGLRDAAARRIANPLPDGVEYVGTVGEFLGAVAGLTPDEGDHYVRTRA